MNTATYQQTQKIQLTLTPQEMQILALKGQGLGYDPVKFIKFLISQEVYNFVTNIPTYQMSENLEKETQRALKDYRTGKLKAYKSVDHLFANL